MHRLRPAENGFRPGRVERRRRSQTGEGRGSERGRKTESSGSRSSGSCRESGERSGGSRKRRRKQQRKCSRELCKPVCRKSLCLRRFQPDQRNRLLRFCYERVRKLWCGPAPFFQCNEKLRLRCEPCGGAARRYHLLQRTCGYLLRKQYCGACQHSGNRNYLYLTGQLQQCNLCEKNFLRKNCKTPCTPVSVYKGSFCTCCFCAKESRAKADNVQNLCKFRIYSVNSNLFSDDRFVQRSEKKIHLNILHKLFLKHNFFIRVKSK